MTFDIPPPSSPSSHVPLPVMSSAAAHPPATCGRVAQDGTHCTINAYYEAPHDSTDIAQWQGGACWMNTVVLLHMLCNTYEPGPMQFVIDNSYFLLLPVLLQKN